MIRTQTLSQLQFIKGDILKSPAHCLVNTVNCEKIMGKGLAHQVKLKYPEVYESYKKYTLYPGDYHVYWFQHIQDPPYVVFNMPTKKAWAKPSQYYWIAFGLMNLAYFLNGWSELDSVAIPPLGCGNGGLNWNNVKQIIEDWYTGCKDNLLKYKEVFVYEP